jgi:hypothetical protein
MLRDSPRGEISTMQVTLSSHSFKAMLQFLYTGFIRGALRLWRSTMRRAEDIMLLRLRITPRRARADGPVGRRRPHQSRAARS